MTGIGEDGRTDGARERGAILASPAAGETKRLTIDIPRELHRVLKVRAVERDLTMAGLVRSLITEWVENDPR